MPGLSRRSFSGGRHARRELDGEVLHREFAGDGILAGFEIRALAEIVRRAPKVAFELFKLFASHA
jgi:hypothetical protein